MPLWTGHQHRFIHHVRCGREMTNDSEMALPYRGVDNSGGCAGTVLECRTKSGELAGTILKCPTRLDDFPRELRRHDVQLRAHGSGNGQQGASRACSPGAGSHAAGDDAQLAKTFGENRVPDLSFGATASQYLAAKMESQQKTAETNRALSPLTPGFPGPSTSSADAMGWTLPPTPDMPFSFSRRLQIRSWPRRPGFATRTSWVKTARWHAFPWPSRRILRTASSTRQRSARGSSPQTRWTPISIASITFTMISPMFRPPPTPSTCTSRTSTTRFEPSFRPGHTSHECRQPHRGRVRRP